MNKRSLFGMIFGKQKIPTTQTQLQMLSSYDPYFSTISDNIYDNKVARQVIDRIATHGAKLIPKHIKENVSNHIKGEINFMLSNKPNPVNNTYAFLYRVISILYTDSNCFVFIKKGKDGFIEGFYPILATTMQLLQDNSNNIYLQFQFINGKIYTLPYGELIHLRLFYNKHDIYGERPNVLKTDLQTAQTSSEGIKNAIRISSNLKGVLKFQNAMLKPKDMVKAKDDFVKDYLAMENESGLAVLDGKAEFQELNLKPITLDKEQLERVNYNVYDYFGVAPEIVNNSFNSVQWNAFYEGVIEPLAMQMEYEFTNKIFSDKAIKDGNRIIFSTNRLKYANLDSKINLLKVMASYGMITVDEGREMIELTPLRRRRGKKNFTIFK